ncbi:MAG: phospholipase D-like domain-containing protein [Duodenibacillus sp.]
MLVNAPVRVVFAPEESGVAAIRGLVDRANKEVRLSAFHFKSKAVAEILVAAHKRGVDVAVIIDRKTLSSKKCTASILSAAGIPVYVDAEHRTAHNKYLVVDGRIVQTGSYNYSDHAEFDNAENLLILEAPEVAQLYQENWIAHRAHCKPLSELRQ